ncbi:MAG: protein translocase subunit SecD [Candidatus Cloacimonetes bacterium]|nr:protein translocase subunit SecD [Candidatus Cloacimonadota bacterium]
MKNTKIRGLIILIVFLGIIFFIAPMFVKNLPAFWAEKSNSLKLGLDLQGGSQIMLEVDYSELKLDDKAKKEAVKTALEIIRNRIDQFGVAEPSILPVGENRIIVQLPGLKDPSRAKELIGKTALLEFKLLADEDQTKNVFDILNKYLEENIENYPYIKSMDFIEIDDEDDDEVDVLEDEEVATDSTETDIINSEIFTDLVTRDDGYPGLPYKHIESYKKLIKDPAFLKQVPAGLQLTLGKEDKEDRFAAREFFILKERTVLSGKNLKKSFVRVGSQQSMDPKTAGKPYVSLEFDKKGSKKFENITGQNINKRLAIVLDDIVYSAPVINDKIKGGQAQITGGAFTMEQTQDLVIVLNAGNLPAPVNIIEERTVGPTLGSDSIKAGTNAALYGMIAVVLFMIIYYGLSGFIADIALIVNIGFILAVLTMLEAALTMPGIAGMILTIGMAVDANVLIFERIREEMKVGKTVRSAVNAGFDRATITILDANITTLITAIVLYQFGTGPIKGFAVTLSIGIIGSMFASIIMVKAIFDGFITNQNRTKLSI